MRRPPAYRIVYVQSHVRTRQWFKDGETFAWRDGETNGHAVYAAPKTRRKSRALTIPARQARAFRVIDNRTSELTSWDTDLLPDALSGLNDLDIFSFDDVLPLAATAGKPDLHSSSVIALTLRVDTPWTYISASALTSAFSDARLRLRGLREYTHPVVQEIRDGTE